jgi:hypothetical protein
MTLNVVPEGLLAASAAVEELTARMAAAQACAAPVIGAVAPPAADPVSLQAAAEFSAHGLERAAIGAEAAEELGRSGLGVAESAESYTVGDVQGAAVFAGGLG